MNEGKDIRWKQRFENYRKALAAFNRTASIRDERAFTEAEQQGLIQAFEFTFELAWNVMKDYLAAQGVEGIVGSRGAIREAFANNLIADGQTWMDMIDDQNISSHSYDQKTADELAETILGLYRKCFCEFETKMLESNVNDTSY
jgi:nucleotidyltransferase substrate binding protein (TIGR01987 family)